MTTTGHEGAALVPTRLDKYIMARTGLSRRQVGRAIYTGRVRVEDETSRAEPTDGDRSSCVTPSDADSEPPAHPLPHQIVWPSTARVWLDGVELHRDTHRRHCYFAYHKPRGQLSVVRHPGGRHGLDEVIGRLPAGASAVGRLDRDTSGLLLITTDGDLAFSLTHPNHRVPKHYLVGLVDGSTPPTPDRLSELVDGVMLSDGPARAVSVERLPATEGGERIRIVVDEGRKHVVRRMIRAVGLHLSSLHREAIGTLALDCGLDWKPADIRPISEAEVEALWNCAGGREAAKARALEAWRRRAARMNDEGHPDERLEGWLRQQVSPLAPTGGSTGHRGV